MLLLSRSLLLILVTEPESLIKEVEALGTDYTTVSVYWYPRKETGDDEITGYTLQYRLLPDPDDVDDAANDTTTRLNFDADTLTHDLENLEEGALYQVVVYANTSNGMDGGSDSVFITVGKDAVGSPKLGTYISLSIEYKPIFCYNRQVYVGLPHTT